MLNRLTLFHNQYQTCERQCSFSVSPLFTFCDSPLPVHHIGRAHPVIDGIRCNISIFLRVNHFHQSCNRYALNHNIFYPGRKQPVISP